jgi:hypothetical protein
MRASRCANPAFFLRQRQKRFDASEDRETLCRDETISAAPLAAGDIHLVPLGVSHLPGLKPFAEPMISALLAMPVAFFLFALRFQDSTFSLG